MEERAGVERCARALIPQPDQPAGGLVFVLLGKIRLLCIEGAGRAPARVGPAAVAVEFGEEVRCAADAEVGAALEDVLEGRGVPAGVLGEVVGVEEERTKDCVRRERGQGERLSRWAEEDVQLARAPSSSWRASGSASVKPASARFRATSLCNTAAGIAAGSGGGGASSDGG